MKPEYARNAARQIGPACRFGLLAVEAGFITERQLADALDEQEGLDPRPRLGELLVRHGWMDPEELETVLQRQAQRRGAEGGTPLPPGVVGSGRLGRFVLVESLGEGGSGEVWKAWDSRLARWVAVKTLRFPLPSQRERFLREARLTAGIQHPHIVPIHEVDHHEGMDYLVLEYKDGASLDRTMLDLPAGLRAVRQVCEAVAALHAQGIVHRDIKPQNILIDRKGDAFLTDLGLARALESENLTVQGTLLGTPAFMAPEQVRDSLGAGPASDVYALGGVLYFVATRRPPADGPTLEGVLDQLIRGDLVAPRRIDRRIPRDVETVILKAMERDPRRRYPTAQAMADDLGRHLRGESILARPIPALRRALQWARRRSVPLAVTAALAGLALVADAIVREKDAALRRQGEAAKVQLEYARELRVLADSLTRLERLVYEPDVDVARRDRDAADLLGKAEALAARFPAAADPHIAAARASFVRHEWKAARSSLNRGLRLEAAHPEGLDLDARLLLTEWAYWFGRIDESERNVRRQRAEVEERMRTAVRSGAKRPLLRAFGRYLEGDAAGLSRICEERIAEGGHTEAFHLLLGVISFVARRFDEAERRFTLALDRAPAMLQALMLRASCRRLLGRRGDATMDAERAIRLAPNHAEGYDDLGRLYGASGRFAEAIPVLRKAIQLEPDLVLARGALAECLSKTGEVAESERAFAEALAACPDSPLLLCGRALMRAQRGLADEALADLHAALASDPGNEPALTFRARIHLVQGRAAEARADIDRAFGSGRPSGNAHLLRGRFLIDDGRFEEARRQLGEARKLGCDFPDELAEQESRLPKP